ncbi:hypothetical protein D3C84_536400 [compost metagenome]
MREHTDLGRRAGFAAQPVEMAQGRADVVHRVDGRIEAYQRIARAHAQAGVDQQGDAAEVVGGVVGLQARGQGAGQPDQGAGLGRRAALEFFRQQDQLVHIQKLGQCSDHHACQRPADLAHLLAVAAQQPVLQGTEGEIGDVGEGGQVDVVVGPHDTVDAAVAIGQRVIMEVLQGEFGQHLAGGLAGDLIGGSKAGDAVAGLADVGGAEHRLEAGKFDLPIEYAGAVAVFGRDAGSVDLIERFE